MKQPLWAVSSFLLLLGITSQLVFLFLKTPMPRRVSLEPEITPLVEKKINITVDIKKIYEVNDLFGTYIPTKSFTAKSAEQEIPAIPQEPSLIPLSIPVEIQKVFIAPLAVTLKGVMYIHDRPEQSVAIIQFQDSKEEINYRVGQLINDAQILKIYQNRVVVVRSGGQQETLYLRENDAGKDLAAETVKELLGLSIPLKNDKYQVPVEKFISHVKNLGQFIDLLDLTTVYQKGKSVGCRVAKADKDSLGSKLGFVYDDIVQQVDGLPVTDISSRVLVFDHILQKKIGDTITVQIERSGKSITLQYGLVANSDKKTPEIMPVKVASGIATAPVVDQQALYNIEEQRARMLEHKVKMAPTAHQIEAEERKKMFEVRRRELLANKHHYQTSLTGFKPESMGQQIDKKDLLTRDITGARG